MIGNLEFKMQKYEDDLMYASEAIQKIASEAMQRVENLYKLRFSTPNPEPRASRDPEPTRKVSKVQMVEAPEKIDTTFDLVDNFTHNLKPATAEPAKAKPVKPNLQSALTGAPTAPIDQRPEKIDSNLHGLTL
jgi:hypothetical protein